MYIKTRRFSVRLITLNLTFLFSTIILLYSFNPPSKAVTLSIGDFASHLPHFHHETKPQEISATAAPSQDNILSDLIIQKGDNLVSLLTSNGITHQQAHIVANLIAPKYNLHKLRIGQKISVTTKQEEDKLSIANLSFKISPNETLTVNNIGSNNFEVKIIPVVLTKKYARAKMPIQKSFFNTLAKMPISMQAVKDISQAFSYDLDFQRDIKAGSVIEILYEKFYDNNSAFSHSGNIIYACITLNDNKKVSLFRYKPAHGEEIYFSQEGQNSRKDLLRTPIQVARISSRFGVRKHPVLGYSKMHQGVDFAAKIGTPILAAGNGVIVEIGERGSFGRYIRIKHNNDYSTAYAHISRFAKNLRKGERVKQGQVIAYVGNTGRTTGPHLHFEVHQNGRPINPIKVRSTVGEKLTGKELESFEKYTSNILRVVSSIYEEVELSSL